MGSVIQKKIIRSLGVFLTCFSLGAGLASCSNAGSTSDVPYVFKREAYLSPDTSQGVWTTTYFNEAITLTNPSPQYSVELINLTYSFALENGGEESQSYYFAANLGPKNTQTISVTEKYASHYTAVVSRKIEIRYRLTWWERNSALFLSVLAILLAVALPAFAYLFARCYAPHSLEKLFRKKGEKKR